MSRVQFSIGSKSYDINCGDGEEEKITHLANSLDQRVKDLSKNLKNANESFVLAVTALMMEDEIQTLQKNASNINGFGSQNTESTQQAIFSYSENDVLDILEPISDKLEKLANKLNS